MPGMIERLGVTLGYGLRLVWTWIDYRRMKLARWIYRKRTRAALEWFWAEEARLEVEDQADGID